MLAIELWGVHPAGSSWHVLLTAAAFAAEASGLLLIVAETGRARREEFGELGWLRRFVGWVAAGTRRYPITHTVGLSATLSAHARTSGSLTVVSTESQVDRLERELRELRARLDDVVSEGDRRHAALQAEVRSVFAELDRRLGEFSEEQRVLRRKGLRLEVVGARLFIFGALLSAAANLVS